MGFQEKRRDPRLPLDSVLLPFLGSREEDHVCFEYLPLDLSLHGIGIAIPNWLVNRERLQTGDLINLNVPFALQGKTFHQGKVAWTRWDDVMQAQLSGLSLEKEKPPNYPLYFSLETSRVVFSSPDISSNPGGGNFGAAPMPPILSRKETRACVMPMGGLLTQVGAWWLRAKVAPQH